MASQSITPVSRICKFLYLSGSHALRTEILRNFGIKVIISVTDDQNVRQLVPQSFRDEILHVHIALSDNAETDIASHFENVADQIARAVQSSNPVLLHCAAGVSRSATLCIAYLMREQKMTLREAYVHVKSLRAAINPNLGFWRQLITFETELYGKSSVKLVPRSTNSSRSLLNAMIRKQQVNMAEDELIPDVCNEVYKFNAFKHSRSRLLARPSSVLHLYEQDNAMQQRQRNSAFTYSSFSDTDDSYWSKYAVYGTNYATPSLHDSGINPFYQNKAPGRRPKQPTSVFDSFTTLCDSLLPDL